MKPFRAPVLVAAILTLTWLFPAVCLAQEGSPPAPAPDVPPTIQTTPAPMPATSTAPETKAVLPSLPAAAARHKGKKDEYTGPNETVELPPTPMLDEEGKQRLDPDGKPMFNLPVKQQRDKKGHPLFDEAGKPVFQTVSELGYDEKGKKLHPSKVKPPKMTPVSISRGALSVDGMTARAALNYEIADFKYLYLFAPGIGVAVVSNEPFPGATPQAHAFNAANLSVTIGEHTLALANDKVLLGKGIKPGYVLVNRQFALPSASPEIGYGTTLKAPYTWPGAKPNANLAGVAAPPVPTNMLPTQLLKPCPAGQMRRAAPKALPGQVAPEQPCMPIPVVKPASTAAVAVTVAPVAQASN